MNTGLDTQGFTIVEIIIVLAVTAALFVSGWALIAGQQSKTQYNQAANDSKSQIDTLINNVATGYYSDVNSFNCTVTAGKYLITPSATDTRGTNQDCIFIGRAVQFDVSGSNGTDFNVYNIIGHQYLAGTALATTLTQAQPIALTYTTVGGGNPASINSTIDTTEPHTLLYGLSAAKMYYNNNPANKIGAFALISSLGAYSSGALNPGAQSVNLYAVTTTNLGETKDNIVGSQLDVTADYLLVDSVDVCMNSGDTNQHADLVIGNNGQKLASVLTFGNGPC